MPPTGYADPPRAAERVARRHEPQDLPALLRAARRREEWAWRTIVTRFRPLVLGVARRHGLAPAEQDEVVGQTWLRLVVSLDSIRTPEALSGWLATTARHEALALLRRARREVPTEQGAVPERAVLDDVEGALVRRERRVALHDALARVTTPRQRRLVSLLLVEPDASYERVSAVLDMPIGSIGPTRARCLGRLREDERLAALADAC